MLTGHPVLQEMIQTGCTNQTRVVLAFETYLELCEVHILRDVEHHFSKELDLIYLSSKDKDEMSCYVPVPASNAFSPSWMQNIQKEISKNHSSAIINVVVRESDTSSVYYKVSPGIIAPPSPETTKKKKAEIEKKDCIQSEFRKRKAEIYEKAKQHSASIEL